MSIRKTAYIIYIASVFVQWPAITAGLDRWIGLHWIIAVAPAFIISLIPLLGTFVATFGAVSVWHWSWLQSTGFFFGIFVVIAVMLTIDHRKFDRDTDDLIDRLDKEGKLKK